MDIPAHITPPSLSVCVRDVEIINIERLIKELNIKSNVTRQNVDYQADDATQLIDTYPTLHDVFTFAPSPTDLVTGCLLRFPINNSVAVVDCKLNFKMSRYFVQDRICYRFSLISDVDYSLTSVLHAKSYAGLMYQITMNSSHLFYINNIKTVIHGKYLPYESRNYYAKIFRKQFYRNEMYLNNYFEFSYSYFNFHNLEPPYDTKCTHMISNRRAVCHKRCLSTEMASKLNRLPYTTIIEEFDFGEKVMKTRVLSDHDVSANISMKTKLLEIENHCTSRCNQQLCNKSVSVAAIVAQSPTLEADYVMHFRIIAPNFISITVEHYPALVFNEYLIYVLSCLGTWLGVSVIELNPANFMHLITGLTDGRRGRRDKIRRELRSMKMQLALIVRRVNELSPRN